MARPEKTLDGASGPLLRFAADLRALRRTAPGLTYREMAGKANYSATVLSQAAAGRKLPTLEVTRAYVLACGGDWDDWSARWRSVAYATGAGDGSARDHESVGDRPASEHEGPGHRPRRSWATTVLAAVAASLSLTAVVLMLVSGPVGTGALGGASSDRGPRPLGTPANGAPPPQARCSELPTARACFDGRRGVFWVKDAPPGDSDHAAVYWSTTDGAVRGRCHNMFKSTGPWVTCTQPDVLSRARTPITFQTAVVNGTTVIEWGPRKVGESAVVAAASY